MKSVIEKLLDRESRPDKVGKRITALRETLKLSKAEFADSIGLDRSSLTKIEAGKAGLDIAIAERISGIYGVGLDFIYRNIIADAPGPIRQMLMVNMVTFGASLSQQDQ